MIGWAQLVYLVTFHMINKNAFEFWHMNVGTGLYLDFI